MIYGKTHKDRIEWAEAYAWLPVKLSDGRWIWREAYFYRDSRRSFDNTPFSYMDAFRQRVLIKPDPLAISQPLV